MSRMGKRVWFITGGKGSGKSTAACRKARPSEIGQVVVFDTEDSMSDIIEQNEQQGVEFGAYIRAYERFKADDDMLSRIAKGKLPWVSDRKKAALCDYWEWFVKILDETLKPEHTMLAIDTIEPIEAAATAWAETNRSLSGWSGKRAYGGLEVEAIRPLLQGTFEAFHRRGVQDIFITSHLKNPWVEYAPGKARPVLDKVKPGGRLKVWSRISTAMLWVVRPATPLNPAGAPSAIVLKARAGGLAIDKERDEWIMTSQIPPRIPLFDWAEWRRYREHGWDPHNPQPGETLLPNEKRMISELLSDREYQLMILGAEIALQEQQQERSMGIGMVGTGDSGFELPTNAEASTEDSLETKVRKMAEGGMPAPAIAQALSKSLPVVKAILGG